MDGDHLIPTSIGSNLHGNRVARLRLRLERPGDVDR
jgi:hypothetical protein